MVLKIISYYIAPWALAQEELPAHIQIEPSFKFDYIEVDLPKDVSIRDTFNLTKYKKKGSMLEAYKIAENNFFGFTVAHDSLFEATHLSKSIVVRFVKNNVTVEELKLQANFYRPHISLLEAPMKIEITDDTNLEDLIQLKLRVRGFGDVVVKIEHKRGKKYEVNLPDLFREIVRRVLYVSMKTDSGNDTENNENYDDTSEPIDIDFIAEESIRLWGKVWTGSTSEEEDLQLREAYTNWLRDPDFQNEIMKDLADYLEDIVFQSVQYYSNRFPAERVDYRYGSPEVKLTEVSDTIGLKIRYWDSIKNEYESLEFNIDIYNQRKEKKDITLGIHVNWIIEPYKMSRGYE